MPIFYLLFVRYGKAYMLTSISNEQPGSSLLLFPHLPLPLEPQPLVPRHWPAAPGTDIGSRPLVPCPASAHERHASACRDRSRIWSHDIIHLRTQRGRGGASARRPDCIIPILSESEKFTICSHVVPIYIVYVL